jgi:hypothetical protein
MMKLPMLTPVSTENRVPPRHQSLYIGFFSMLITERYKLTVVFTIFFAFGINAQGSCLRHRLVRFEKLEEKSFFTKIMFFHQL